jgi:hypothetical protein
VVVKGDAAVGVEPAGARLADVVHQRGEPGHQVGRAAQPELQLDRLVEHGQGVLVDVLVPVVLVPLEAEGRQLGQYVRRQAGVDQEPQTALRTRRQQQLLQLHPLPLGSHDDDALGHRGHRGDDVGGDGEVELRCEARRPQHPQRVVGEGALRPHRGPQHSLVEVAQTAERVGERVRGQG